MIADLDADTVEDGQHHPFVVALVKELRAKHEYLLRSVEMAASTNAVEGAIRANLGTASGVREVLRMIEEAKGKPE